MSVNHLLRGHAPLSDAGWELLDEEARQRLAPALGARKLIDFSGPLGWDHSASNLGRVKALEGSPTEAVIGLRRKVMPLVELRADFALSRSEMQDADRGAPDTDLGPLDEAAREIAVAENISVFHGWPGAIAGISERSPYDPLSLGETAQDYPRQIAGAVEKLLCEGVGGPYGLALGREQYRRVIETQKRFKASGLADEEAIMAAFEENAHDTMRVGGK